MEPYDSSNMYNIFTNQLKLKNKERSAAATMGKLILTDSVVLIAKDDKDCSEQTMEKSTLEFMRNLKLVVKKLHLRFEDDILMPEKPYAIGLVINVILCYF